ncbi:MAG: hypothetical protein A3F69_05845 [Acidobacteria bacterium RIFCSPLOWO2_12_FULL_66_10]|nr:MAG: hypothetical protein A3F69_05845 [Acidobacteria bacterium RIFCSPLOWO2_12_FULL_66_10]
MGLGLALLSGSLAAGAAGQEGEGGHKGDVWYKTPVPEIKTPAKPMVGPIDRDAAGRGEISFYQRCALCHLDRMNKDETFKQILGVPMTGILKDASPSREAAVRELIKKGGFRMPGFQYSLNAKQMDELVAYLKTQ